MPWEPSPEFRRQADEYRSALSEHPLRLFAWSGRRLRALHRPGRKVSYGLLGTVAARTWVEAALLLALKQAEAPEEDQVDDVLIRQGNTVERAWERRHLEKVLDNASLRQRDSDDENAGLANDPGPTG